MQRNSGRMPGERLDQRLAAGTVHAPHTTQVPVVAAGFDQRREPKLLQRR
jgi:hypothetical protein